ncbi:biotin transporter BioY [Georgenia faecalis]|uniref:Biotin transporter n=1 Tax=Georgenia faecalis TaxID=2483799 RepID=A0ABV9DDF2_9MICO|nr:biotin transporter BioY [Georgenia faecalis]
MTATTLVLADVLPASRVKDAALVAGGAAVTGLLGQVAVPLPFTPVPLSLGTFAVLLVGAALGPARGALSMVVFVLAGMAGVPWFAGATAGAHFASFGYVLGYVLAAATVGALARRQADRRVLPAGAAAALATLAVYACGVPWLMAYLGIGLPEALALGVAPFLVGDVLKALLAASLLPAAWRLVGTDRR